MNILLDAPVLLQTRGLAFARGSEPIFGPLDLCLHAGELILVEGGNGSGKTTLLRILAGLLSPTEGDLIRRGTDLTDHVLLGHHFGLKAELTPLEHLRHLTAIYGHRGGITAHAALTSVGLMGFEDNLNRTLSAGQRKRVALAALLLLPQLIWLLDEPYANLDAEGQVLVDRMLRAHLARGGGALITSHGLIQPKLDPITRIGLRLQREAATERVFFPGDSTGVGA